MNLLLDTCAVIWAISQPESLSKTAISLLEHPDSHIVISAITAAEIACASERGKIIITPHWRSWLETYVKLNHWAVEDISLPIVIEAYSLPDSFHPDPADRIIIATARLKNYLLITADRNILDYPHVNTAW